MSLKLENCLLYAVTDTSWLRGRTLAQQVEEALRGGATMVQLREKELQGEALEQEAREILARLVAQAMKPFPFDFAAALNGGDAEVLPEEFAEALGDYNGRIVSTSAR